MKFRSMIAGTVVLAAATVWGQGTSPVNVSADQQLTSGRQALARRRALQSPAGNKMNGGQTLPTLRQRMEDMESTLNKMHTLLKQMRAKAASSSSKDSLAKANLAMWELMLSHLDRQFDELRVATLTREDLEARRAALYKQADAKAAAARQARPQASPTSQVPAAVTTAPTTESGKAGQGAPTPTAGQTPTQPAAPDSGSPK